MSFWSGETIETSASTTDIIAPFDKKRIDCAAYTLRMGGEYFVTPEYNAPDLNTHTKVKLDPIGQSGFGGAFQIPPGQFAFLLTEEYLKIPNNCVAFISLKTHPKWRGIINVSGFHVDGGFEGHLIYAVYNAGPRAIHLQRGQDLFLIWFADVDNAKTNYFRRDKPPQRDIDPKLVTDIASPILSSQSLSQRIEALEWKVKTIFFYATLFSLLASGIITIILNWHDVVAFFAAFSSATSQSK